MFWYWVTCDANFFLFVSFLVKKIKPAIELYSNEIFLDLRRKRFHFSGLFVCMTIFIETSW